MCLMCLIGFTSCSSRRSMSANLLAQQFPPPLMESSQTLSHENWHQNCACQEQAPTCQPLISSCNDCIYLVVFFCSVAPTPGKVASDCMYISNCSTPVLQDSKVTLNNCARTRRRKRACLSGGTALADRGIIFAGKINGVRVDNCITLKSTAL